MRGVGGVFLREGRVKFIAPTFPRPFRARFGVEGGQAFSGGGGRGGEWPRGGLPGAS